MEADILARKHKFCSLSCGVDLCFAALLNERNTLRNILQNDLLILFESKFTVSVINHTAMA